MAVEERPVAGTAATRLPRTTGSLSGLLIVILGVWGALIVFVGPYFHYAFGSYSSWHYTSNRLWLDILPGAVAVLGGLLLLSSARRTSGMIGGWLAIAAGAWFAVGPAVSLLWHKAGNPIGAPTGGHLRQAIEQLGYFYALGALIIALAAFAAGRYFSRPRLVEDAAVAAGAAAGTGAAATGRRRTTRADEGATGPGEATGPGGTTGPREPRAGEEEPPPA